jgi:hypothetical protein
MSVSHRASVSLRMSRLDNVDVENQRDKSDGRRLSSQSNARRKSEVAQEDTMGRDIDAAVRRNKQDAMQGTLDINPSDETTIRL